MHCSQVGLVISDLLPKSCPTPYPGKNQQLVGWQEHL